MNKLSIYICRLFGHEWRYNFKSLPNKAICERCKSKSKLNLRSLEWEMVKYFDTNRTDDELIRDWIK